ncbi:uncharacterized protein [Nicotiana sylvestris]|uniref:uncharacterized protein n=1 Tax=Nicotiana sylvestris TaxID=4096 RepID=UPI00388CE6DF
MARELEMDISYQQVVSIARKIEGHHGRGYMSRPVHSDLLAASGILARPGPQEPYYAPLASSAPLARGAFRVHLPGMPPDRDIDFGIDLLLGTQPISIPPYCMAPLELQELQDQLQELLDKVSSAPPTWGAFNGQSSRPALSQSQPPRPPRAFFECGNTRHMARDCPRLRKGAPPKTSQPQRALYSSQAMFTAPVVAPPAQPARGGGRKGRSRSKGEGQARYYALPSRTEVDASNSVITAYVRDVSTDTPIVDLVPLVRYCPDVFPANLPVMPPDRDIDFGIDLFPGTQLISIPPYDMAPPKLEKLKEQLQELLDKGFIRSSDHLGVLLKHQYDDPHLLVLKDKVLHGNAKDVTIGDDGVKYEHQRTGDFLQQKEIPKWKWEHITMDFIVGLPRTLRKFDAIWGIMDRLTKSMHFFTVCTTYSSERLAEIYIWEIVRMHGLQISMISDRGRYEIWEEGEIESEVYWSFEVLRRVGKVARELALPPSLAGVYPVFHVSMLWRYHCDPSHVLDFSSVQLDKDISYVEEPIAILARQV